MFLVTIIHLNLYAIQKLDISLVVFDIISTFPLLQIETQTTKRIDFVFVEPSIKPCATAGAPLVVEEKAKDGSRGSD